MSTKPPAVPPAEQSPKGPGEHKTIAKDDSSKVQGGESNLSQQGRQGDIRENTPAQHGKQ